jgi:hypothetical protein
VSDPVILTVGIGFTVTATVLLFTHDVVFVPVTVKILFTLGVIAITGFVEPVLHEKLSAPLAVRVLACPWQILSEPLILTVGLGATFTCKVCVLLQPAVLVPITL